MMMKKPDGKISQYTINLVAIEGEGAFPCPKCGTIISPDDETEINYKIIDTKIVNDELAELVIACGKCRSVIRITGFQQGL
jgi:phage terminase large subunit GpA-like protein